MYEMTTLGNNTRIRESHTVFGEVVTSVNANVTVQGDQVWMAPADGAEVKQGDQWLHVTSPSVGWMAFTHKGVPICKDLKEVVVEPPPPTPTPDGPYGVKYILSDMGLIDQIRIYGPARPQVNIFYNDDLISGL